MKKYGIKIFGLVLLTVLLAAGCAGMKASSARKNAEQGNYATAVKQAAGAVKADKLKNDEYNQLYVDLVADAEAYYQAQLAKASGDSLDAIKVRITIYDSLVEMYDYITAKELESFTNPKTNVKYSVEVKDYSGKQAEARNAVGNHYYTEAKKTLKGGSIADARKAAGLFSEAKKYYQSDIPGDLNSLYKQATDKGTIDVYIIAVNGWDSGSNSLLREVSSAKIFGGWVKKHSGMSLFKGPQLQYANWAKNRNGVAPAISSNADFDVITDPNKLLDFGKEVNADVVVYFNEKSTKMDDNYEEGEMTVSQALDASRKDNSETKIDAAVAYKRHTVKGNITFDVIIADVVNGTVMHRQNLTANSLSTYLTGTYSPKAGKDVATYKMAVIELENADAAASQGISDSYAWNNNAYDAKDPMAELKKGQAEEGYAEWIKGAERDCESLLIDGASAEIIPMVKEVLGNIK